VLWFYLIFVLSFTMFFFLYRISTLFFDQVRYLRLYSGMRHK
jgi:hypothetical protein